MRIFTTHEFTSLAEAVKNAGNCKILEMRFINHNLKDSGQDFIKLKNLKQLHIQGSMEIFDLKDFQLPQEIGMLSIKSLTLLNLPIKLFPHWISTLSKLRDLMVRGTDITSIPEFISTLKNLRTLRIENCPLAELPFGLRNLDKLRELGLSDTQLLNISPELFPKKLSHLNLVGNRYFDQSALDKLQSSFKKTKIFPS